MEGDGAPDNTPFDVYVNPRVATNTTMATSLPKRVLKLPRPPGHPDGPGPVDIEVIKPPCKLQDGLLASKGCT